MSYFDIKGYARLGAIYKEFNELDLSKYNFSKALSLEPNNEEYKNSLADVKKLFNEQDRSEHLNQNMVPRSREEQAASVMECNNKRTGKNDTGASALLKKTNDFFLKEDPASLLSPN